MKNFLVLFTKHTILLLGIMPSEILRLCLNFFGIINSLIVLVKPKKPKNKQFNFFVYEGHNPWHTW
jgi:hypothetical protein